MGLKDSQKMESKNVTFQIMDKNAGEFKRNALKSRLGYTFSNHPDAMRKAIDLFWNVASEENEDLCGIQCLMYVMVCLFIKEETAVPWAALTVQQTFPLTLESPQKFSHSLQETVCDRRDIFILVLLLHEKATLVETEVGRGFFGQVGRRTIGLWNC